MPLSKEITASLSKQSATIGWDALVAYNRKRVNQLFYKQYQEKVSAGEHYPPFNHQIDTYGLIFSDIILGPPLISFENSGIEDSAVTVRLKFISGNFIRLDSDKQVILWEHFSPTDEYAMVIHAKLRYGSGTVSEHGTVSIHFNEGTLLNIEGMGDLPDEVLAVFRSYLQEHAMDYQLGELKQNDGDLLYPKSFIVRTQRHPDAASRPAPDNTDGAVLLFIETNLGGRGNLPGNEQPWILPDDKTAALLISEQVLFGQMMADNFESRITNFQWESTYETDGSRSLLFTDGYVPTTNTVLGNYSGIVYSDHVWSSDKDKNKRPARLNMRDFKLRKGDDGYSIQGTFTKPHFTDVFTFMRMYVGSPAMHFSVEDSGFDRSGKFNARVSLDSNDNVVFNSVTDFSLKATDERWDLIGDTAEDNFAREASDNLNKSGLFELASIKTFYLSNLLFPNDHILNFSEVAVPGDLVLYGDMAEDGQTLNVAPQESTIAAGQTLTFSATLPDGTTPPDLVWSLNGVGSINNHGLYTAPEQGDITQAKNVLVTASNAEGLTGTALMTVAVSPVEITTKFILVKEEAQQKVQFTAHVSGTDDAVTWSVQSDSVFPGSIDSSGLYTPPETGNFDDGFNVERVVATLPSGQFRSAIVCLWGTETVRSFLAEPAFYTAVSPQGTVDFSTRSRDFDADQWSLAPALGELSVPESHQEGNMIVWSSTYTASSEVPEHTLVMVRMSEEGHPWHGGYGVVELLPPASNWSKVKELVNLEIISANGSIADSVYGNNTNQSALVIKITAIIDDGSEIEIPFEDVYPHIELIDYNTGEDISIDNKWSYSQYRNDYSNQSSYVNKSMVPLLYVTCNSGGEVKKIAVRVRLTNPNASYEYYSTDLNSHTGMDSGVTITSMQPIDYSNPENLIITGSDPVQIKDNIKYSVNDDGTYHDEYNGECLKYAMTIAVRGDLSTSFRTVELNYSPIVNETVSDTMQNWENNGDELSFSCLVDSKINVCSVGGYTTTEGDPALNSSALIFFELNNRVSEDKIRLNGNIYFEDAEGDEKQKYRMTIAELTDTPSVNNSGEINFCGYLLRLPGKVAKPLGWSSTLNEITISVIDNYGNSGSLKLHWDGAKHYLIPSIN